MMTLSKKRKESARREREYHIWSTCRCPSGYTLRDRWQSANERATGPTLVCKKGKKYITYSCRPGLSGLRKRAKRRSKR